MTYREAVFIVFDELKITSDDSIWENDHVIFLLNKYRSLLIKQRYAHLRKDIPLPYYQKLNVVIGENMKSIKPIPNILNLNGVEIDTFFENNNINIVSPERFPYVRINKWLANQIYVTFDRDGYLNTKGVSATEGLFPLGKAVIGRTWKLGSFSEEALTLYAILENPLDAAEFNNEQIQPIDVEFPIEHALFSSIVEQVIKELGQVNYLPEDPKNNAADDFGQLKPQPAGGNTSG